MTDIWTVGKSEQERMWRALLELIKQSEIVRPDFDWVGYEDENRVELRAPIAWESSKVAIVLENANTRGFEKYGWKVFKLPAGFVSGVAAIADAVFAVRTDSSAKDATNPSKPEQVMMAALLDVGLPEPDRNHKIFHPKSGKLLSVPDFVWIDQKILLDLDGIYHHKGRGTDVLMKEAAAGGADRKKILRRSETERYTKDQKKRRVAQQLGWAVLVCSDDEVMNGGAKEVALNVREMFDKRMKEGVPGASAMLGLDEIDVDDDVLDDDNGSSDDNDSVLEDDSGGDGIEGEAGEESIYWEDLYDAINFLGALDHFGLPAPTVNQNRLEWGSLVVCLGEDYSWEQIVSRRDETIEDIGDRYEQMLLNGRANKPDGTTDNDNDDDDDDDDDDDSVRSAPKINLSEVAVALQTMGVPAPKEVSDTQLEWSNLTYSAEAAANHDNLDDIVDEIVDLYEQSLMFSLSDNDSSENNTGNVNKPDDVSDPIEDGW